MSNTDEVVSLIEKYNNDFCLHAFGIGSGYFTPLMISWEWLIGRRGLASGIILCGFGFGSFIFGFITTALVNPDNESAVKMPDGDHLYTINVANNVPKMLRYLSFIWIGLAAIGIILIRRNPSFLQ